MFEIDDYSFVNGPSQADILPETERKEKNDHHPYMLRMEIVPTPMLEGYQNRQSHLKSRGVGSHFIKHSNLASFMPESVDALESTTLDGSMQVTKSAWQSGLSRDSREDDNAAGLSYLQRARS